MSQSLDRGVQILEFLSEGPLTLADLAARLQIHRSTTLRLLQTLEGRGYARRVPNARWALGFSVIAAAHRVLASMTLRDVAHEYLLSLFLTVQSFLLLPYTANNLQYCFY